MSKQHPCRRCGYTPSEPKSTGDQFAEYISNKFKDKTTLTTDPRNTPRK